MRRQSVGESIDSRERDHPGGSGFETRRINLGEEDGGTDSGVARSPVLLRRPPEDPTQVDEDLSSPEDLTQAEDSAGLRARRAT